MLFNSIDFAIFLPLVFGLYWLVGSNLKLQNIGVLFASYLFYAWWDWRFLSLIIFSTVVDFSIAIMLSKQESPFKRKTLLWISIVVNLGLLGFFKYYNFFLEEFLAAFSFFGSDIKTNSLNIILPVGISFYTFQTLSYTIDVYKKKLVPTNSLIDFSAFVSFFPQLVAGPIERAINLLPQFYVKRKFDYNKAVDGMRQVLWGLFKKIVIADNCAEYVNLIFSNSSDYTGSTLLIAAIFFAFQIYGDFSGYSDIAIGVSRLFGFELMQNFAFPYFSRDIAEFWRRWHISLSTWFRDYLYIPLGGSRGSTWGKIKNTFIIFIVSGFWHGANWTYIAWGVLNAIYFTPLLLLEKNRNNIEIVAFGKKILSIREFFKITRTFTLTVIAWIFFRAESVNHAIKYISTIFSSSLFTFPEGKPINLLFLVLLIIFCTLIEWEGREFKYALGNFSNKKKGFCWTMYLVIATMIYLSPEQEVDFIYFQF